MIRNLLNSLSSDRSQTDSRLRKNNEALNTLDGVDRVVLDFGDISVPAAPATVHGQVAINTGANATLSSTVVALSGADYPALPLSRSAPAAASSSRTRLIST